jgi:hypothetical protein
VEEKLGLFVFIDGFGFFNFNDNDFSENAFIYRISWAEGLLGYCYLDAYRMTIF